MARLVVRPLRQTYPIWSNTLLNDPFVDETLNFFFGQPKTASKTNGNGNGETYYSPRLNLVEDQDSYYAYFMLPGVNLDKLEVEAVDNKVSIKGESAAPVFGPQTPAEGEKPVYRWLHHELPTSALKFRREFELPLAIDLEQIKAAYENGVLRLMLPKAASTKPRKIAVQVAESGPAQLQEGQ